MPNKHTDLSKAEVVRMLFILSSFAEHNLSYALPNDYIQMSLDLAAMAMRVHDCGYDDVVKE